MSEPQKVLCHEFKASMLSPHPMPIDVLIGRLRAAGGVQAEIGVPGDAGIQDIASMAGRIKGTTISQQEESLDEPQLNKKDIGKIVLIITRGKLSILQAVEVEDSKLRAIGIPVFTERGESELKDLRALWKDCWGEEAPIKAEEAGRIASGPDNITAGTPANSETGTGGETSGEEAPDKGEGLGRGEAAEDPAQEQRDKRKDDIDTPVYTPLSRRRLIRRYLFILLFGFLGRMVFEFLKELIAAR